MGKLELNKTYSKYSDSELFAFLHDKKEIQECAFAELYSRYSQRIYAYCLRVTGNPDDARDIFQEAFLKFFKSAQNQQYLENVPGYLLTIARNLCLNFKRDKKINVDIEDYTFRTNDKGYEQKELMDLISKALDLLEFDYREAFILRQYQGLSYKEISDITGNSVAAVKNRVWRAKEKIKTILQPYLNDLAKY